MTKTGSGAFTLTGANTYSGGTTISNGQVNINYGGSSTANSAIGTGPLTIAGGAIDNTSGSAVTLAPNTYAQHWNGDFTFIGSANLNLGTSPVALGGNRNVTVNANTLTVGGPISGTGFSMTKNGPGTLALSASGNSYSGNTIVGGGTLTLTGTAAIASSPTITVSNGATFDVSGLSSTFTLGGSQSLFSSGTINGSVTTSSGSQIYADTGSPYGTNTFNNNLTLVSGAVAYFDLGTVANGMNDLIVVGGNLALNGNPIHIKAPSSSVSLDTSDYTLFTVTGTISGTASVSPIWDVQPVNFNHYSIEVTGNAVKLHYSTIGVPGGTGSASPNPVGYGQNTLITVTVTTPGSAPVSSVILNATPIGGASSVSLVEVGATASYTNTVTVGEVAAGSTPLSAIITDTDGGSGSVTIPLTILPGTETWDGGSATDNNWSDTANWVGGVSPLGGNAVIFHGTTRLAPVMDQSFSLGSVTFDSTAGSFDVTNAPGAVLTLTGSGVINNSANAQALNTPVVLNSAQAFTAAAGNMTVGGVVSGGSLTVNGTNALTLAGTNNYGGGTSVSAGTVVVANNSALGGAVLTLAGGSVSNSAGMSYIVPNNVSVSSAANVGVGSGDTFTLSGTISGGAPLTKIGNGSLLLTGANNNLSGGVTVSSGTLALTKAAAVGSGLLTLDSGSSLSIPAGYTFPLANTVSLAGAANVIVGTGDDFTLSGLITNTGSLTLGGPGTLTIGGSNPNTYTGGTLIGSGAMLDVENATVTPVGAGPLTFAGGSLENAGLNTVTLSNNIVTATNTTSHIHPIGGPNNNVDLVDFVLAGNISGPGNIIVDGSANAYAEIYLSGDNSGFTGTLSVQPNGQYPRLRFASSNSGSASAAWVFNSATTDAQSFLFGTGTISFGALSGNGWMRNDVSGITTLRIGDLGANCEFDGFIPALPSIGADFALLKVGTGTLTLTNDNTYTGPTEIAGGQLIISEYQGYYSTYQVDDGATLGVINYPARACIRQQRSLRWEPMPGQV